MTGPTEPRESSSAALTLVLATRNRGKVVEFRGLLGELPVELVSLDDCCPGAPAVEETGETFVDNALLKAKAAAATSWLVALADDSGLEVDALDGQPGVHSARYAGSSASDAENNAKLLGALREVPTEARGARFRCVLTVLDPLDPGSAPLVAEGTCEGRIALAPSGAGGFGYDPLFLPSAPLPGREGRTLAELGEAEKNALSHRGAAARALVPLLRDLVERKLDQARRLGGT